MSASINHIDAWLEIACRKLSASARERIAQEIKAHYADAVDALLVAGLSEADARSKALADLGNPATQGKRFRREFLTQLDVKRINYMLKRVAAVPSRLGVLSDVMCICLFCLFSGLPDASFNICALAILLSFLISILEVTAVLNFATSEEAAHPVRYVFLDILRNLAILWIIPVSARHPWIQITYICFFSLIALSHLFFIRKLRRIKRSDYTGEFGSHLAPS